MRDESICPGWHPTTLREIASWGSGGTPSRAVARYFVGTIPWIKTGELGEKYIRCSEEKISEEALNNSSAKIFPKNSVGIAMYGATIGKLSIWGIDASTNQACAVGVPSEAVDKEYLYYFLLSERETLIKAGKGGAQPNISQGIIKEWPIALPPLREQHRIVAKIEELFSELDQGIESLKTAQAQLKVYRQALLKHAFEGKLTAQWRANNPDKLETADALLKSIQHERAQRYLEQLAEWEAGGKEGARPKAPKTPSLLTAEELAELPQLEIGWVWIKYGDLCSHVRNGISAKPEGDTGAPIFRISAVRPMFFDMADIRHIQNSGGELDSYYLQRGDLVFTRYNGSRRYVGVCAEYRSDEKRLFPDKLVQTRVFSRQIATAYLEKALNSGASRRFVESKIRTTAGQSGVSGEDIKNIPVPICSFEEQNGIMELLEPKLSETDHLEHTITNALQQTEALRQSILKQAFSGKLVPQDSAEEPASVQLARIEAEKSAQLQGKKTLK
ncbi:restriction endonuclease subunit S [Caballeronia sordidicola]|uniref:restriction endonuclease subunit S n=1 Tax=Caballeronia sordidicola TaxID=196367 RepID=UPI00094F0A53|nr:restriction endonuclease subunit S [Caballeronia sordidicola]